MKLVGLMPVRNEAWVLGLSARAALKWCDELVLLNHFSTDRSGAIMRDVLAENPGRVRFLRNFGRDWREMEHREAMLNVAREHQPTHIAIIDADEILTGNLLPRIRKSVEACPEGSILQLPLYNLRGGIGRYHASGTWGHRIVSLAFKDSPAARWDGDKFHSREPLEKYVAMRPLLQGQGGVMHLWGASERRLRAKHALYKVTERLRWPDKSVSDIDQMYSMAIHGRRGVPGDNPNVWTYKDVPDAWWEPYRDLMQHLDVDAEPWQTEEVGRLLSEHGAEKFAGLDLFGEGPPLLL